MINELQEAEDTNSLNFVEKHLSGFIPHWAILSL
jgi:hypothetical protein